MGIALVNFLWNGIVKPHRKLILHPVSINEVNQVESGDSGEKNRFLMCCGCSAGGYGRLWGYHRSQ